MRAGWWSPPNLLAAGVADVPRIEVEHVNFAAECKDRVFAEFLLGGIKEEGARRRAPSGGMGKAPRLRCNPGFSFFRLPMLLPLLTRVLTLLAGSGALLTAAAQTSPEGPPVRHERSHEHHVISADGTQVTTYRFASTVLREEALEALKRTTLSHSRSAQALEIVEAYTRKPNGRRIPVGKNNYQVTADTGRGKGGPLFSDTTRTTLVFPQLTVGDTVVLSYRIKTREPLFPGKVSMWNHYSTAQPFDDVRVTVELPERMAFTHASREMKETVTAAKGMKRIEWTWRNPTATRSERQDYSVWDPE